MKCMIKSMLAAMIVALLATSALAQDQVVLSTSNSTPAYDMGTSNGLIIPRTIGEAAFTAPIYVWVSANTGDEIAPQTVGYTDEVINGVTNHVPNSSAGIDLSYTMSAQTLVAGWAGSATTVALISGAQDYNPTLNGPSPTTSRWDAVSNVTQTPAASLSDVNAVAASVALDGSSPPNVTSSATAFRGLENTNGGANTTLSGGTGGSGIDPQSATVSGTKFFLLGVVNLNVTAFGTAQIAVTEGSLGMYQGATDKGSSYTFDPDTVRVALQGDANLDGTVDQNDINMAYNLSNWQHSPANWATNGDVNGDGVVDQNDINTIYALTNWQKSIVGSSTISGVPEPCSFVLLGLGSVALLAGCRKVRSRTEA